MSKVKYLSPAFTVYKQILSRVLHSRRQFRPVFLFSALNLVLMVAVGAVFFWALFQGAQALFMMVLLSLATLPLNGSIFATQFLVGSAAVSGRPLQRSWILSRLRPMLACLVKSYFIAGWNIMKWSVPAQLGTFIICAGFHLSDPTTEVIVTLASLASALWGASRAGWLLFVPAFVARGSDSSTAIDEARNIGLAQSGWAFQVHMWMRSALLGIVLPIVAGNLMGDVGFFGLTLGASTIVVSFWAWLVLMSVGPEIVLETLEAADDLA